MYIDLDNINFYNPPPPPKPPARASSSSGWTLYNVSSGPQLLPICLPPPIPPRPPAVAAAIPTPPVKDTSRYPATSRNIFDIELENASTREKSPTTSAAGLEAGHQSGSQPGDVLGTRCLDVSPTLVPSTASELPSILEDTHDCEGCERGEGEGNLLDGRRGALQSQPSTRPGSPGEARGSSRPVATVAEANSDYSRGRPSGGVDYLPADSDSLQPSLSGWEAEDEQTVMMDGVPKDHSSRLPSPALSGLVSPPAKKCGARPDQHHGFTFEELPSEAARHGERARSLAVSVSNTPTAAPSIASTTDASSDCEDNGIPGFHGPSWEPPHKPKLVESALAPRRVPRPRANTESNQPDRRPSIAVVIPVRQSASSLTGTSTDSFSQTPRHPHTDSASSAVDEGRRTVTSTKKHSRLTREAAVDGGERPQKRRRRDLHLKEAARNNSACTRHYDRDTGSMGVSQHPSGVGLPTSPEEAQEIFGRGIIRIQPHGPRHVYFLTFVPDAVDRPPCHVRPRPTPDRPLSAERATLTSSTEGSVGKGNMQLARRRTQNRRAKPKAQNRHSTRRENSRKGMPWSPEEEKLLAELKGEEGLPWSTVTRLFSAQYKGRSKGSIQVYWSTNLKKRLP